MSILLSIWLVVAIVLFLIVAVFFGEAGDVESFVYTTPFIIFWPITLTCGLIWCLLFVVRTFWQIFFNGGKKS